MRNKIPQHNNFSLPRGMSLVVVLFFIVVASLLVVAMAQLNRGGSNAVGIEIQSTRALFAAESGAQIAAMKIFPISGSGSCANFSTTFSATGLSACNANITCTTQQTTVSGTTYTLYAIASTGICGSGESLAQRRIAVELRSLQ